MRWASFCPTPLALVKRLASPAAAARATSSGVSWERMASPTLGPTPLIPVSSRKQESSPLVAKPNRMEKTISGSMALRLSRPTKSSVVKKFTIMSAREACSPMASVAMSVQGSSTGGTSFMTMNMMTAATAPVTTKVSTVVPMILPARFRLRTLATELEMEANTSGTTTQNIILMNTVPAGLIK